MVKTIDTLLEDVASILEHSHEASEENLDKLADTIRRVVKDKLQREGNGPFYLRFSNLGYPDRYLWYSSKRDSGPSSTNRDNPKQARSIDYATALKFLIGDIYEAVILFLIKESGHSVTDEQKKVTLDGIEGSMDAKIDGVPVDIKSASSFSFRSKFTNGNLANDDHYGYITQLSGYAQADESYDESKGVAFLGANKETGELALFHLDGLELTDVKQRIKQAKELVQGDRPTNKCYREVDDGKSGNRTLAKPCTWCPFRFDCWADSNDGQGLRAFKYANGIKYLTHVEKLPNVDEVPSQTVEETPDE